MLPKCCFATQIQVLAQNTNGVARDAPCLRLHAFTVTRPPREALRGDTSPRTRTHTRAHAHALQTHAHTNECKRGRWSPTQHETRARQVKTTFYKSWLLKVLAPAIVLCAFPAITAILHVLERSVRPRPEREGER